MECKEDSLVAQASHHMRSDEDRQWAKPIELEVPFLGLFLYARVPVLRKKDKRSYGCISLLFFSFYFSLLFSSLFKLSSFFFTASSAALITHAMSERVTLLVYDLSQGMARTMSLGVVGRQIGTFFTFFYASLSTGHQPQSHISPCFSLTD